MTIELHGLDTEERVCFYEQDYYMLSNFSSFAIESPGGHYLFPTVEHYYHYQKFILDSDFDRTDIAAKARYDIATAISDLILSAKSAHEAFAIAQQFKAHRRPDWDEVKVEEMRYILRLKIEQHEYVKRKLLATGDRELVENSWRDDIWGWGENQDGQNLLGKLWMELRAELREQDDPMLTPRPQMNEMEISVIDKCIDVLKGSLGVNQGQDASDHTDAITILKYLKGRGNLENLEALTKP